MDYRSRSRPPPREYSPRNERDDYFQPTFDRNHRSRSLDYRRDWSDEEDFEREREREGRAEYGQQRQLPRHPANLSPVSQSSARPLKIQTARQQKGFFGQRREQADESPRSIGYPPRDSYREAPRDPRYRYDGRELQPVTGPRDFIGGAQSGGGYSRSYQSYHQSHQSGGGGLSSSGRRALTVQPGQQAQQAQSWKYQGNTGPRQYHRVHCGCFSFTWPPWSVQPSPPPQPRYPNIP